MDSSLPATLGRRIADCRDERGWTQKQLAERAGLSVTFLSELENDRRGLGSDALLRLADALGTSLDYLVKGELDAPRPRPPLVIPPELAEAAEERRWSLGEARDLLKARQLVVARRSQGPDADDPQRRLTKEEWFALHERLFG